MRNLLELNLGIEVEDLKLGSLLISSDLAILDEEDMYGGRSEGAGFIWRRGDAAIIVAMAAWGADF